MKLTTLKSRIQLLHKPRGGWRDERRGSSTERGYGSQWQRLVKQIRQRDGDLCQPCVRRGQVGFYSAVDHIVNKAMGGGDGTANLEVICAECHRRKTAAEARGLVWDGSAPDR